MPIYFDRTRVAGEEIRYRAHVHWFWSIQQLFLDRLGAEYIVSNRRIFIKEGIFSTRSTQLDLDQIETISIRQQFWGKVFRWGDVVVYGTGGEPIVLRGIARPSLFIAAAKQPSNEPGIDG